MRNQFLKACVFLGIIGSIAYARQECSKIVLFEEHFDGTTLSYDPRGLNGWTYFTGDGRAEMTFTATGKGYATISVDATRDKLGIWWALIKRCVSTGGNLELLQKAEYEFRIEARIRVSDAPKRVNLHLNTQRTTDFHTHLMEFDIPDTVHWHTISMTTRNFDARPGDTVYAQLALMDWGFERYRVDIDYFTVSIVNVDSVEPDDGEQVPYHPPVPPVHTFTHHLHACDAATVDTLYTGICFSSWYCTDVTTTQNLIVVGDSKIALLRWDMTPLRGKRVQSAGVLELTTHSVQRLRDSTRDFGLVRVCEILGGDSVWNSGTVTYESWKEDHPFTRLINSQMIIDVSVSEQRGGKTYCVISKPVLQRMIDGKTKGLALRALGLLQATFYGAQSSTAGIPILHCSLEDEK